MPEGMVNMFKKVGSRFAFELFLEMWKEKIVEMLKQWLSIYTVEDIDSMISKKKFPDVSNLHFGGLQPYVEYMEKISTERLFVEYIAPARPDLAEVIQNKGMDGAQWLVDLRFYLLDKIKNGVQTETKKPTKSAKDMVQAHCDQCDNSWPVPREEFDKITECPFCGAGKDDPSPSQS